MNISEDPNNQPVSHRKREALFIAFITLICAIIFLLPSEQSTETSDSELVSGIVTKVDNSNVGRFGIILQGEQRIWFKPESGLFAGKELVADNVLKGDPEYDHFYEAGQDGLFVLNLNEDGSFSWAYPSGPNRLRYEFLLAGLFAILLLAVLGWTGIKALLSFAFAGLLIWKMLIPALLAGYSPYPMALIMVTVLSAVIMFLIGGLNRRGLTAFLGCISGLGMTALLSWLFAKPFYLNGAVRPFAKNLLTRYPDIDLGGIFLCGIFICASGAIMDLAMDVAAAMEEISRRNPEICRYELGKSGLKVGRAVVGTMTTTLLLAYSGGYTTCMMWFSAQGIPPQIMLNTSFMSAEILNTLAGSFGLITVAPMTALAGTIVFGHAVKTGKQPQA